MQINPQVLNSASNVSFSGDHLKAIAQGAAVVAPMVGTAVVESGIGAAIGAVAVAAAPVAIAGGAVYGLYKLLSDD